MKKLNIDKLKSNIDEAAAFDIVENNVFGSAYFVMQEGKVVYEKCFGSTGRDDGSQVEKNSIFRLASMTKPITSIAVLILVDRGLISLTDPIKKYLPEFENIHVITDDGEDLGVSKTDVTILHLLTHTSGFGKESKVKLTEEVVSSVENTIDAHIKAGLRFEPFTSQTYVGYATFDVLVALVEKITGEDYGTFLEENIFKVCNMNDTTFVPSNEQWGRVVAMHSKVDGKSQVSSTREGCIFGPFPAEHKLGGAGLVSTLQDYARFAEMLLNRGKVGEKEIVSSETFDLLDTPHVPKDIMPGNERWGLGVRVITEDEYKDLPVGSIGWSGAYGSHFWVDYENKIAAVFMKNSRFDGGDGNMSARRFEKAVFGALTEDGF